MRQTTSRGTNLIDNHFPQVSTFRCAERKDSIQFYQPGRSGLVLKALFLHSFTNALLRAGKWRGDTFQKASRELEVKSKLRGQRAGCYVVGSAERGEEVIQRVSVCDIDRGQLKADFVFVSV
jgi:hypothetical protein